MGWALVGALWIAAAGRGRSLRAWPYVWLASCVAVSVTLPLFAQRLRAAPPAREPTEAPLAVVVGLGLATCALVATPWATGAWFVAVMLVLHLAIVVPAVFMPGVPRAPRGLDVGHVATALGIVCATVQVVATVRLLVGVEAPITALLDAVRRDPAQASITTDVLLSWLACALLAASCRGRRSALLFLALAPIVSFGAAFAWIFLRRARPLARQ
jgi:hypothetical protein